MGLRDILKKKDRADDDGDEHGPGPGPGGPGSSSAYLGAPEVTFIRSDTVSQEVIYPPNHPDHAPDHDSNFLSAGDGPGAANRHKPRRSLDVFRSSRSRSASVSSRASADSASTTGRRDGGGGSAVTSPGTGPGKRLSQRLHLSRAPPSSENVPENLPEIVVPADGSAESQWEKRATILAGANDRSRSRSISRPSTPVLPPLEELGLGGGSGRGAGGRNRANTVSSKEIDSDIQEAIRLHEEGDLERSTAMFGKLAAPNGANNPLSQVLYGLALRHGWGCKADPEAAITYLSKAASNAAVVENLALQAGLKKGGAAKGELVLAIFELANCFRHGWGVPEDPIAAKQYYETAANLGDTDAMNEVAWCYLEGFGCKKDKFAAARYYRLAEQNGNKTLGNSWIWKDKYDPGAGGKKK